MTHTTHTIEYYSTYALSPDEQKMVLWFERNRSLKLKKQKRTGFYDLIDIETNRAEYTNYSWESMLYLKVETEAEDEGAITEAEKIFPIEGLEEYSALPPMPLYSHYPTEPRSLMLKRVKKQTIALKKVSKKYFGVNLTALERVILHATVNGAMWGLIGFYIVFMGVETHRFKRLDWGQFYGGSVFLVLVSLAMREFPLLKSDRVSAENELTGRE